MTQIAKINCRTASRLLHERLAGELEAGHSERLAGHLEDCEACRRRAERLHGALGALRELPAPQPPADLAIRIRRAARQSAAPAPVVRRWRPAPALAAAVAVVALVAAVAWYGAWDHSPQPAPTPIIAEAGGHVVLEPRGLTPTPAPEPAPAETADRPALESRTTLPARPAPPRPARLARPPAASAPRVAQSRPSPAPPAAPVEVARSEPEAPRPAHTPALAAAPTVVSAALPPPSPAPPARSEPRIAAVSPRRAPGPAVRSEAFADEVVGGLVAGVLLTTYLDGAPAGLQPRPAPTTPPEGRRSG